MLELLFVGAGPHSLATLTRLLEPNPDPGVDAPQRHVNAKAKVLSYWQWQRTCPTYRAALTDWLQTHVAVVDPSGDWMTRWHQQFSALGISHLRSTTAVHPDPLDSYALATYASAANRTSELLPLEHIEKSREFVGPFAVPGTKLFEDFCKDLVHRYCLDGLVMQDKVLDLTPVFTNLHSSTTPSVDHWQILLASGRQLTAKQVVLAVGSTNKPRVPEAFQHLQAVPILSPGVTTPHCGSGVEHLPYKQVVIGSIPVVSSSTALIPSSCSSDQCRATPSLTSSRGSVGASPRPSSNSCTAAGSGSGSVSASPLPGASSCSSGSGSFSMLLGAPAVQDPPELQCSSLPAVDSSCTSDSVTLAGNKQATGSIGSSGSNAESECCSGCCDGACSNSSGWSSDSMVSAAAGGSGAATATAAAATAMPGKAAAAAAAAAAEMGAAAVDKPAAATVGSLSFSAIPASRPAPTVGAACRDSSSTCSSSVSSVSSPGSICDSLDNWVLVDRTVPDAEPASQPCSKPGPLEVFRGLHSRHVQDDLSEPQSASSSSTVFNSNLSDSSSSSSLVLLDGHRPGTLGVAAESAAAGRITEPAGAAAEGVAVALGPCSWVSTCSSPTDGCDSLCSWLGCEHTAAAAAATAAALDRMGDPITTPPNSSSSSSLGSAVLAASAETASSITSSEDRCRFAAAAGTYPWGRLMHAWQLVEALTTGSSSSSSGTAGLSHRTHSSDSHGTNCDSCSGGVANTTSSNPRVGAGKGRRWRQPTSSSSSSKSQQGSKAAGSSAAARSAMLLQQQGLLMPGESVMIVGGGLTTAHLAALAAAAAAGGGGGSTVSAASPMAGSSDSSSSKAGQMSVSLLLRGGLRVKQFDVDIEYMGRNRGSTLQFGFRQLGNFEERLALMKRVLQGGSVTPEAAAVLSELRKRGVLEVHEHSEVLDASWDWEQQRWDVWLQDGTLMHADRLWLATGSALSTQADPLLSKLLQKLPMPLVAGLPTLQPTLEWSPNSGMYVLGAYAALQLGPGALNLAGAKTGSVIVGQQLNDVLPELPRVAECGGSSGAVRQRGKSVKGK